MPDLALSAAFLVRLAAWRMAQRADGFAGAQSGHRIPARVPPEHLFPSAVDARMIRCACQQAASCRVCRDARFLRFSLQES